MSKVLEIVLFVVLFILVIYLFLLFIGLYQILDEKISDSELKMNDKINEIKTFYIKKQ
ncbi:MAG: hypothetical protein IKF91_02990 [Bacilli bacterium]|nr:hypothetical protein [Bacilli bacterium]